MTVGNPENFKVKLITSGREEVDKRIPCNLNTLTLDKLYKWIDSQQTNSLIKQELKKSASRFPQQALGAWQKNYIKHLSKAQAKLRNKAKETQEIEEKEADSQRMPNEDFDGDNL